MTQAFHRHFSISRNETITLLIRFLLKGRFLPMKMNLSIRITSFDAEGGLQISVFLKRSHTLRHPSKNLRSVLGSNSTQ